jgi:hypothetical protein
MGKLRVTSLQGDRTFVWDQKQAGEGDLDAQAAVREAERIFAEQLRRGGMAFKVAPRASATRLVVFDPEADQIVTVPRVVGG